MTYDSGSRSENLKYKYGHRKLPFEIFITPILFHPGAGPVSRRRYSHRYICSHCWWRGKPWQPLSSGWGGEAASPGGNKKIKETSFKKLYNPVCVCVGAFSQCLCSTFVEYKLLTSLTTNFSRFSTVFSFSVPCNYIHLWWVKGFINIQSRHHVLLLLRILHNHWCLSSQYGYSGQTGVRGLREGPGTSVVWAAHDGAAHILLWFNTQVLLICLTELSVSLDHQLVLNNV